MQTLKNGSKVDGFLILRLIARGGMGEVYEAYEEALERKVALKIVTPSTSTKQSKDLVRRFKQEAKILAKVNHPNIVTVYGIKSNGEGIQYLAMELVEGVSFKDFLKDFDLPLSLAVHLFMQSLAAVQVLHRCNIIHRDLKPSNILFLKSGEIKILDFGIAQMEGVDTDTNPGVIVGSVPYMAPELSDGFKAGWRTECWSMGAVLYEVVTRQHLYHRLVDREPKFSDQDSEWIPQDLLAIISKACAKDPEVRYNNSDEMMNDLKICASKLGQVTEQDRLRLQGRVKELVNRARSHTDVEVPAPVAVDRTMLPPVPEEATNFFSATIIQKKNLKTKIFSDLMKERKENRERRRKEIKAENAKFVYFGGGAGALAAVAYVVMNLSSSSWFQNLQASLTQKSASASEVAKQFNAGVDEGKVVAKNTMESKPAEAKPVEAPKPVAADPVNQLLFPSEGEAVIVDGNFLEFKWSQELGSGQYSLEVARDGQFNQVAFSRTVSGQNFIWKKPVNPGPYFWRLKPNKSKGGKETGAQSFLVMNSFAIKTDRPSAKQEFMVEEGQSANVEFKWQCKFGVDQYLVEVASSQDFGKIIKSSQEKGCEWSAPLSDGKYFWRVKASKTIRDMDFVSAPVAFQVNTKPAPKIAAQEPEKPKVKRTPAEVKKVVKMPKPQSALNSIKLQSPAKGAKAPTRNGQISIEFAWDPDPSAGKYVLELSGDADFSDVIQRVESQDHRVLVEKIKQKGKLYWRVKAEGGSEPGWSEVFFLELL